MFVDYLYLDDQRITSYYKTIGGYISKIDKEIIENKRNMDGSIGIKKIGNIGGASTKQTIEEKEREYTIEDILREFEEKLKTEHYNEIYFELEDQEIDIKSISKGSIVKFEAKLDIPIEFEEVDLIKSIVNNDNISDEVVSEIVSNNPTEEALFKSLIKDGKDIPVVFDIEDIKLFSSIKGNCLKVNYDEFEENIDEYVTVLARVDKVDTSKSIKIYDKYKDLFRLGRSIRRSIENDDGSIYIDGPAVKLSIVAMYV